MNNFFEMAGKYIYGYLVGGLLLLKLYTWFALPVFTNLPVLNYYQAIGLTAFMYLFNKPSFSDMVSVSNEENRKNKIVQYAPLVLPWVVLGSSYLLKVILGMI